MSSYGSRFIDSRVSRLPNSFTRDEYQMSMQVYVADTHTTCETIIERAVLGQASFGHLHSSDGVSVPLSNQFILPNSFVAGWPIAGSVTNVSVSVYLCDSRVRWFSHPLGFSRTNTPMETANRNSSSNRSRYIRSTQRGEKKERGERRGNESYRTK